MNEKSLLEVAYDYVSNSKKPVAFKALWAYVTKEKELSADEAANKVSQFYTTLLLDGRFVTLGDNTWDLRSRHTFDKVHIDMKDVYSDVDAEDEVDAEEESLIKEYKEDLVEPSQESNNDEAPESEESENEEVQPDQYQ